MASSKDTNEFDEWSPDPKDSNLNSLSGFLLGRSEEDDSYRLYLNAELNHYAEFAKSDTVHAKRIGEGRVIVWLKPGTKVRDVHSKTVSAEFLRGEIQRNMFRGTSGIRIGGMTLLSDCPGSGCAHCTASCSSLPGTPPDTAGFTCNC